MDLNQISVGLMLDLFNAVNCRFIINDGKVLDAYWNGFDEKEK